MVETELQVSDHILSPSEKETSIHKTYLSWLASFLGQTFLWQLQVLHEHFKVQVWHQVRSCDSSCTGLYLCCKGCIKLSPKISTYKPHHAPLCPKHSYYFVWLFLALPVWFSKIAIFGYLPLTPNFVPLPKNFI